MVVLKKIKASTLMETLVATVLIIIVFVIASMILNNLFSNVIKSNTSAIDFRLNELQYLQKNNKIKLPYKDEIDNWNIRIETSKENNIDVIDFEAFNTETNKTVTRQQFETKQ